MPPPLPALEDPCAKEVLLDLLPADFGPFLDGTLGLLKLAEALRPPLLDPPRPPR